MIDLKTRHQELQTLQEISRNILTSPNLQLIAEHILDKILSIGPFDLGAIRILDSTGENLVTLARRGYRDVENARRFTIDMNTHRSDAMLGRVAAEKSTQVVENLSEFDGLRTFRSEGVQSAIVVPVLAQGQIFALIQVGSRTVRKFHPSEVRLIEIIGEQLSIGFQKARLFTEADRRRKHAEALREIGLSLTSARDPQQVLQRIAEEARRLTEAMFTFVATPDRPFYRVAAVAGEDQGYREVLKISDDPDSPYGRGPLGRAIRSRKPVICEDVLTDPLFTPWREIASARGIRSLVAVPISVQERPIGALLTYASIPRAYDDETMSLLSSLAAQAAAALENARLFQETERRAQEFESLVKINRDLVAVLDREILLPRIAEEARKILKVDSSVFRLVEGEYLILRNASDPESLKLRPKLRIDEGLSGKIVQENRVIAIRDIFVDSGMNQEHQEIFREAGYRSFLGVPLRARDHVIGTLNFHSREEREFQPEEINMITALANQAAIAIENAGLYQESRRQEEIQKLLKELSQDITSLDVQSLLKKITEKVREFFAVDICDIRMMRDWQPVGVSGIEPERIRGSGAKQGRSKWILENRRPLIIADITKDTTIATRSTTRRIGLRGYLAVPLFSRGGEVTGVLRALTYQPREFTKEEVDLLQQLANGAAIALENARLFQETEGRAREQAALNEIAAATSQSLHLDELLKTAMDKVLEVTGRERGHIRLKDPVTGDLVLAAYQGLSENYAKELLRHQTPGGKSDRVFKLGEPLVMNNPEGSRFRMNVRREGIRSIAWIPLKARGRVIGILNVSTSRPLPFAHREIELLQAIGNVIGVAVENAMLFGETQRNLERLRALREIDQGMSSTLDLQTVLDVFLEKMNLLFPYPTVATVRLFDKEKDWLEPVACRNLDAQEWKEKQATPKGGMAHYVFHNRVPLVVHDLTKDPRVTDESFCRRHRLASYMGVPLMAKGECLGVIGLYTRERYRFSDEEVNILLTASSQAALAIYNARLYEEMKKLADHLAAANKVKDEFLSVMSHELRTPLNSLIGYTEMVRDRMLGDINRKQEEALAKALNQAGTLLEMISRVLLTTQIDTGMVKVESDDVNLCEFLDGLKTTYEVPLAKDVNLLWDYPSYLPVIKTDGNRLKHILQNLINNGIKFTPRGQVAISARHPADSSVVEFKVTDTGIGIPKEHLSTIFEKFRQVDSSETRLYGGVGLGLYIAKQMTEKLGGTLEVKSELGKGSIFTVKIPCESQ